MNDESLKIKIPRSIIDTSGSTPTTPLTNQRQSNQHHNPFTMPTPPTPHEEKKGLKTVPKHISCPLALRVEKNNPSIDWLTKAVDGSNKKKWSLKNVINLKKELEKVRIHVQETGKHYAAELKKIEALLHVKKPRTKIEE